MWLSCHDRPQVLGWHGARLAAVAPDGGPHNKPVGYRYNADESGAGAENSIAVDDFHQPRLS
jgi:hypothetical protein